MHIVLSNHKYFQLFHIGNQQAHARATGAIISFHKKFCHLQNVTTQAFEFFCIVQTVNERLLWAH